MGLLLMSASSNVAKGAAATLRRQQHCKVTSPSYCQPRLNVKSKLLSFPLRTLNNRITRMTKDNKTKNNIR
jgi:hypothetical protein